MVLKLILPIHEYVNIFMCQINSILRYHLYPLVINLYLIISRGILNGKNF